MFPLILLYTLIETNCMHSTKFTLIFCLEILFLLIFFLLLFFASTELAVEFGTVLIYTCRDSCWTSGSRSPIEEFHFVQTDPDQKLFK